MADRFDSKALDDPATLYRACGSTEAAVQVRAFEVLWRYLYRVAYHIVRDQPEATALAQDCAQIALVRIHERLAECQEPAAFRAWARRIVSHVAIDELRRRKRLVLLDDQSTEPASPSLTLEEHILARISQSELVRLIGQAPISDRSRRVVLGRYFDELPDETLAATEGELADQLVLPSHVQVTRAKNMAKLRQWDQLKAFVGFDQEKP